jgi:thiamine biosynthesis lipoprotein
LAEIRLRDRALGTSGSGSQFFFHQGRRYGHILDPRTGRPADVVLSSTVLAPTAALADALATAFFVLGLEGATRYCARHPEISALLVMPDSRAGATTLHRVNLSNDECVTKA